jgi:ribose 5-phosphate isomerase B
MFRRIIIASDHGGFDAKQVIVRHLRSKGVKVKDIGCRSHRIVRYPRYAAAVSEAVASGVFPGGILICSTGIGMSIVANRFAGVRASLCTSHFTAVKTREHNDSNVLCLGGKTSGIFELLDIVDAWLQASFIGGRHKHSLGIIREIEAGLSRKR